jgi:hypothetical protein
MIQLDRTVALQLWPDTIPRGARYIGAVCVALQPSYACTTAAHHQKQWPFPARLGADERVPGGNAGPSVRIVLPLELSVAIASRITSHFTHTQKCGVLDF